MVTHKTVNSLTKYYIIKIFTKICFLLFTKNYVHKLKSSITVFLKYKMFSIYKPYRQIEMFFQKHI